MMGTARIDQNRRNAAAATGKYSRRTHPAPA